MSKLVRGIIILTISLLCIGCEQKNISVESQTSDESISEEITEELDEKSEDSELEEKDKDSLLTDSNEKEEEEQLIVTLETSLDDYDSKLFEKANGWTNGYMFDCTWRESNVTFKDGIMNLIIDSDGENASPKWSGGEYRTRKFFSYGLFEVRMKPIKNDGVVSSFFTYTGPSDNNPWDEIDIEFLGKDTTKIQLNYFTNGVGEHEYIHDLGFDASLEFHTYGFRWLPDSITWYVDGEEVYTATTNIPSTPSKVMMNVWPGIGVDGWLNAFDGKVPLTAEYDWIKITQFDNIDKDNSSK